MKTFRFPVGQPQHQYWILVTLVYLTLIYSTSLHYAYKPERTVTLKYFHLNVDHPLQQYYPDIGVLKDEEILNYDGFDFWKLSSFWSDAGYYILQTQSLQSSVAPFKYRFIPTMGVYWLHRITGLDIIPAFVVMNVIFTLLAAVLFTLYVAKYFGFSKELSFIGGILVVTMVAITRTLPFPMLEPASMFFAILIFIAVMSRNIPLFILASLLGVASKEILMIASILWCVENLQFHDKKKLMRDLLISSLPIVGFMLIRLVLGGSVVEVNYGFNLLKGEFPRYGNKLLSMRSFVALIGKIFLSFSFLWLGLFNLRKHEQSKRHAVVIPVVILAAIFFSHRITRVLGILFPVVIPMFLLFFHSNTPIDPHPSQVETS